MSRCLQPPRAAMLLARGPASASETGGSVSCSLSSLRQSACLPSDSDPPASLSQGPAQVIQDNPPISGSLT